MIGTALPVENLPAPVLPHNDEAEANVLGSIMLDSATVLDQVAGFLQPQHFYDPKRADIYACMLKMYERGEEVTQPGLAAALEKAGFLDAVGGKAAVARYVAAASTPLGAAANAQVVRETAQRRQIIEFAQRALQVGMNDQLPSDQAFQEVDGLMQRMLTSTQTTSWQSLADLLQLAYQEIGERAEGKAEALVTTGVADIDRKLGGGFRRGNLITIAGRTGMGKTAFALNLALGAAKDIQKRGGKGSIGVFEMEMSGEEIARRAISVEAQIPGENLKTGMMTERQWEKLVHGLERMAPLPIFLDASPGQSLPEIAAKARALQAERGLDILIVDHVELVKTNRGHSRSAELEEISKGLKRLAKTLDIVIIMLVQMNREAEKRASHEPMLSDLRNSGSFEQDSDIVIFVHRPGYFDKEYEAPHQADIIFAKFRDGRTGTIEMYYKDDCTSFHPLAA